MADRLLPALLGQQLISDILLASKIPGQGQVTYGPGSLAELFEELVEHREVRHQSTLFTRRRIPAIYRSVSDDSVWRNDHATRIRRARGLSAGTGVPAQAEAHN